MATESKKLRTINLKAYVWKEFFPYINGPVSCSVQIYDVCEKYIKNAFQMKINLFCGDHAFNSLIKSDFWLVLYCVSVCECECV